MSKLKHRILFYHTLASLLQAGVAISRALKHRFPGPFRKAAEQLRVQIEAGLTLSEAMRNLKLFSSFECNLTTNGENSGTLPEVFKKLAEWFELTQKLRSRFISGLIYPAFLYTFAILVFSLVEFLSSDASINAIILQALSRLLLPIIIYLIGKLILRTVLKSAASLLAINNIPIFGSLLHKLESARFFAAFAINISAGIDMQKSIESAADCCQTRMYKQHFMKSARNFAAKSCPFSEAFARYQNRHDKNSAILELLETGELSGKLDIYADRVANLLNNEAELLLDRISKLLPVLIYLVIALFIAMKIINLAMSYGNFLDSLM